MIRPSDQTAVCERLDWDSEHFGFPIAQVAGNVPTPEDAEAIDEWCLDRGIRCLYLLLDRDDEESARVAASRGFREVDIRITGLHSMAGIDDLPYSGPETMTVREATEADLPFARRLAARSNRQTRFYLDDGFPEDRSDALYEAWVDRAVRDPRRHLRIAEVDGEPAAFEVLSALDENREGHSELVAVAERHRGRGVGPALLTSSLRLMADRGARAERTIWSARNGASTRLHERVGFVPERTEVWHHKWFPE